MSRYKKVIFVAESGTCRAPMAMGLMQKLQVDPLPEICARGMVVLFPEPLNPKAEAVLAGRGIRLEDYRSCQLREDDFSEDTLVIVFSDAAKKKIQDKYPDAVNVHVLTKLAGEELEIMDPYGGDLAAYGLCMESMIRPLRTLMQMLGAAGFKEEIR